MNQVNVNATFAKDDMFNRVEYAQHAMKIIKHHDRNGGACTLSIDAPWGCGKTTFFRMWINELKKHDSQCIGNSCIFPDEKRLAIYYNAWENDYYEDAFLPLVFSICGELEGNRPKCNWEKAGKDLLADLISCATGIVTSYIYLMDTGDTALTSQIGAFASSATRGLMNLFERKDRKEIGEKYYEMKRVREAFRSALRDLAEEFGKLYVFIDELDRCRPPFAIKTLETIKHFFDIPEVAFIIGIDGIQLSHSIAGMYGTGIDASGYLAKFVDHTIRLPLPDVAAMLALASSNHFVVRKENKQQIDEVLLTFDVSTRDLLQLYNDFHDLQNELSKKQYALDTWEATVLFLILFCMKHRRPVMYHNYLNGKINWDAENISKVDPLVSFYLNFLVKYLKKSVQDVRIVTGGLKRNDMSTREDHCVQVVRMLSQVLPADKRFGSALFDLVELSHS